MSDEFIANSLPLPPLLILLLQEGKWKYPGPALMQQAIPYTIAGTIDLPIEFYSLETIRSETSRHLRSLEEDVQMAEIFHLLRGSMSDTSIELPWIDIERSLFIAGSEVIGDDIEIVLDYRTSMDNPRVVISDWRDGCMWAEVTPTFTEFVERIGLK